MRFHRTVLMIVILLLTFLLLGSSAAQSVQDIYGTIEKGRYVNTLLKFELTVPEGWLIVESEEQKVVRQIGLNAVKTGDTKTDALIDKSVKTETVILFVSEKPLGSIENAAFGMSVTKLPSEGYTPKMLAETFKSVFLKNPKNALIKDISIENIGGRSWANVQIDFDVFGQIAHTNYFVTVIGNQALVANMSYQNSQQLQEMESSFRGIAFSQK